MDRCLHPHARQPARGILGRPRGRPLGGSADGGHASLWWQASKQAGPPVRQRVAAVVLICFVFFSACVSLCLQCRCVF